MVPAKYQVVPSATIDSSSPEGGTDFGAKWELKKHPKNPWVHVSRDGAAKCFRVLRLGNVEGHYSPSPSAKWGEKYFRKSGKRLF
eukprot:CAMPEP_0184735064 /NCGR_PEP_ID=MMETSP0314-20130426/61695_1 /TAXON_ID=38298 /ORGANISM="Rhodella maculata, Strain CCMP 736" /LENGTH=84 /DNA_ID=CAMNT_0027202085 /DNA_START=87 /DNA_END=341 /DNA_ORIENTATION=-